MVLYFVNITGFEWWWVGLGRGGGGGGGGGGDGGEGGDIGDKPLKLLRDWVDCGTWGSCRG